jgi:hypothetical protein
MIFITGLLSVRDNPASKCSSVSAKWCSPRGLKGVGEPAPVIDRKHGLFGY